MAFRTIVIENRCKIEYSLNYLICRKGNDEIKVLMDEIKTLIINSTQVAITTYFISEAIKRKIKIIFTDEKHNPAGEIVPYQNNFYSFRKIKEQINFSKENCDYLWKEIIKEKIINQANNLKIIGELDKYEQLCEYYNDVELGDISNREGHSAKVYFNSVFGKEFSRADECDENKYLDYGYSILLSSINREIKALGYLTEIGIHHIGESNSFNLSCDFIEPLRPLIDSIVIKKEVNNDNFKDIMISILTKNVTYNDKDIILENAIRLYIEDMINYLKTADKSKIKFIKYEL